jgi:hypothetical protein
VLLVLRIEVSLIAHQHHRDLIVGVVLGFIEPLDNVVEAVPVRNVVDQHNPNTTSVVAAGD